MNNFFKTFLLILLAVFIITQFFRPAENKSTNITANNVSAKFALPQNVQNILQASCYDCHSNNTKYPWYFKVQPVAWLLDNDVRTGKENLNFSEFGSYPVSEQYQKFKAIIKDVETDDMPLKYYLIIHRHAKINQQQKSSIINWAKGSINQLKVNYPCDSLLESSTETLDK